jgi:chitinase
MRAIAVAGALGSVAGAQHTPPPAKVVVAYVFVQNREIQPGEIAANKVTRINYAFANIQGGKIVNGFDADDKNFAALLALKQQNPALTVLVSVGGWSWSGDFSDMALTRQSRAVFIASVMDFLEAKGLDGLDIDWEYPAQAGSTDHFRPEDKQNFTLLLKELREEFRKKEHKLHRHLLLTIACGASSSYLAHTEMDKVQQYVDTVNLMSYDYYEPGKLTGNHAPLFTDPADPKGISADRSVREFEQAGVPAGKIVLGVPFYGHTWAAVEDVNHGLFQPGKASQPGYATYGTITATMLGKGFDRYWDAASSVPYLYSPAQKMFVSYEDPESLGIKAKYVLDQKLGGVMFWDYAGDPSGALLDAVDRGLKRK